MALVAPVDMEAAGVGAVVGIEEDEDVNKAVLPLRRHLVLPRLQYPHIRQQDEGRTVKRGRKKSRPRREREGEEKKQQEED